MRRGRKEFCAYKQSDAAIGQQGTDSPLHPHAPTLQQCRKHELLSFELTRVLFHSWQVLQWCFPWGPATMRRGEQLPCKWCNRTKDHPPVQVPPATVNESFKGWVSYLQSVKALIRQFNVAFIMRQYNNRMAHPVINISAVAVGKHSRPKTGVGKNGRIAVKSHNSLVFKFRC